MHTMLIINFNACVFVNCGFSFLFHIGEHKKKHEIALHGLCITNHACAKDGFLLEAMKKSPSKDFAKINSH
jgi:hypothetical protein